MEKMVANAHFVMSNTDYTKCPNPDKPEYAFIGRSNVGKSSLINMLLATKGLAKTSSTPGKTQTLNHFLVANSWFVADLPGYGYAKVSKTERVQWQKMISDYLLYRPNLMCVFQLLDSRHELKESDITFMEWMAESQIPFVLVFTKADKMGKVKLSNQVNDSLAQIAKKWDELPAYYVTSAEEVVGRTELLEFIEKTNALFVGPEKPKKHF